MEKRLLINISGSYIDPNDIVLAKQKGENEVVIHLKGTDLIITVGKEYWATICEKYFELAS
jgi:hypothetical protein